MCVCGGGGGGGGGESGASKQTRADIKTITVKSAGKKKQLYRIDASMFAN